MSNHDILEPATVIEKTGLAAFGMGLLGFFGANIIINVTFSLLFLPVQTGAVTNTFLAFVLGVGGFAFSVWLAMLFREYRKFRATRTGITVSIWLQVIFFTLSFIAGLVS